MSSVISAWSSTAHPDMLPAAATGHGGRDAPRAGSCARPLDEGGELLLALSPDQMVAAANCAQESCLRARGCVINTCNALQFQHNSSVRACLVGQAAYSYLKEKGCINAASKCPLPGKYTVLDGLQGSQQTADSAGLLALTTWRLIAVHHMALRRLPRQQMTTSPCPLRREA